MKTFFVKTLLWGFLISVSLGTHAQDLEIQVMRTAETPGFFLVHSFPDEILQDQPLLVEDIFVTNFHKDEAPIYRPLLPILKEIGAPIISAENFQPQDILPHQRITVLGDPLEPFLSFTAETPEQVLEQFDAFQALMLQPEYLQDIEVIFGGNIYDVYPTRIPALDPQGIVLVGKFHRPMKTLMRLHANALHGTFNNRYTLHLEDDSLTQNWLSQNLEEIWQDLYDAEHARPTPSLKNPDETPDTDTKSHPNLPLPEWVMGLFPWILGGLGISLIFLSSLHFFRKKKTHEEMEEEVLSHMKSYMEKDLPFSVEKKDNKK